MIIVILSGGRKLIESKGKGEPSSIPVPASAPPVDLKARMLLKIATATASASSGSVPLKAPTKVLVPTKASIIKSTAPLDLCDSSDDEAFAVKGMGALSLNSESSKSHVVKKAIVSKKPVYKSDSDDDNEGQEEDEDDYNSQDEKPKKKTAVKKPKAVIVKNSSSIPLGVAKAQGVKRPKKAADGTFSPAHILFFLHMDWGLLLF